ncbi:zinc ABC transporter substrate-binding protein ZnuA [Marinobacter nanhaiticus D15-8W]|uniref:High-affinity zinc uptake system protein ZnuA n=1 Tax=Marinobacter nanhaiticus D15-8W TaxID=626887 RepID=N6VTV6_9GAMM|nr:zinc ABC transporter substrate-binding protein [Marinobacter nanhaiticus]ENO13585.1 ABC transporter substrate-binding protein [Marinobacter nanhaiticus D15-8W]BES70956.1 zinc ABC transporter substrate-binding protein ZnuA [Marinobacter nanhaiticus D15-8W]
MQNRFLPFIAAACLIAVAPLSAADEPLRIVTSIKPLSLLARAIAPEDTQITTLIPAGASPHTYQLRPSDRRALAEADLILWVGPSMETFMQRLLENPELAPRTQSLMPTEEAQIAHEHEHEHAHAEEVGHEEHPGHDHGDGHHHDGVDPHVWLDPALALLMTHTIGDRLAKLAPNQHDVIERRLKQLEHALHAQDEQLRPSLARLEGIDIFTYHDAFGRFAEHYGIHLAGALTPSPEQTPGARHINAIQQKLRGANHPCLLTEPQFNRDWWQSLTEDVGLTISTWDPLASEIPETPDGYVKFQQSLADAALTCLPEQAQH